MAELKLGATEEFSCKAKDGNEVHGLITKPPDYEPGKKYPTLLRIHGGPNGQDAHSFNFERQFFAANGYVVVNVNYRGSSGRGEKYQIAISADWGNLEVVDLQAAVDHVIAIGLADPDRLGVGGWSYGGILTDAIIAKDQRFKAATSGAGTAFPLGALRRRPVHHAIRRRDRPAVEGRAGAVGRRSRTPSCTPTRSRRRRCSWAARRISTFRWWAASRCTRRCASLGVPTQLVVYPGLVPRHHAPELSEGPDGALSRLVREIFEVGASAMPVVQPAVQPVNPAGLGQVHQGTLAGDHGDARGSRSTPRPLGDRGTSRRGDTRLGAVLDHSSATAGEVMQERSLDRRLRSPASAHSSAGRRSRCSRD